MAEHVLIPLYLWSVIFELWVTSRKALKVVQIQKANRVSRQTELTDEINTEAYQHKRLDLTIKIVLISLIIIASISGLFDKNKVARPVGYTVMTLILIVELMIVGVMIDALYVIRKAARAYLYTPRLTLTNWLLVAAVAIVISFIFNFVVYCVVLHSDSERIESRLFYSA